MNEKQTEAFPLKAAYVFGGAHDLGDEVDEIRHRKIKWDRPYTKTSLRRGFITALFEKHRILNLFKEEHWAFGNTPDGESRRARYLRIMEQYDEFLMVEPGPDDEIEGDESDPERALEFAREADLRDFLAKGKNLELIEPGLRLYEAEGRKGVKAVWQRSRTPRCVADLTIFDIKSRGRLASLPAFNFVM